MHVVRTYSPVTASKKARLTGLYAGSDKMNFFLKTEKGWFDMNGKKAEPPAEVVAAQITI